MRGGREIRRRVLWKVDGHASSKDYEGSFDSLLQEASVFPPRKSFGRLCSNALVVVQEICLVSYLLERHNVALLVDSGQLTVKLRARVDRSSQLMCFALSLVVYFSSRAERVPTQTKRTKVRQRLVDGFLLACLLRLSSSLLRSLTASYSSDTVQSLVYFGMLLHLLACDYAYANGKEPLVTQKSSVLSRQKRPPFQGGTVSLNAALFSTTMLISRLQSNVSAFFVVCIAIVLFAFYPATRSAISASYPAHSSTVPWIITASVLFATLLLMDGIRSLVVLGGAVILIGLIIPCWKLVAQSRKRLLRGPWDIPPLDSMQLGFRYRLPDNAS